MTEPVSIEGLLQILIKGQKELAGQFTKLGVIVKSLETDQNLATHELKALNESIGNLRKDIQVLSSRVGVNDEDLTSLNTKVNRITRMVQNVERATLEIAHDVSVVHAGWIEESSDRRKVYKELALEQKGMQAQIDKMEQDKIAAGETS